VGVYASHREETNLLFFHQTKKFGTRCFWRVMRSPLSHQNTSDRGICWSSLHRVIKAKSTTNRLRGLLNVEKPHDNALLSFFDLS